MLKEGFLSHFLRKSARCFTYFVQI